MKRAYRLSELGKLSVKETLIFISTFLYGLIIVISLFIYDSFFWLSVIPLLPAVISLIFINIKKKNQLPLGYIFLLYLMLLSFSLLIVVPLVDNSIILFSFLIITILSYMNVLGFFVYFSLNVLYFWGLKRMFPQEKKYEEKNKKVLMGRKKISKYLALDKQMIYYNINLANAIIYILFVIYCFLFWTKYKGEQIEAFEIFYLWTKEQDWVNFSNGISIFSLLLAIYTITFPIQIKILKEAEESCRERFKEYI